MQIHTVLEEYKYTYEHLRDVFSLTDDAINRLCRKRILKKATPYDAYEEDILLMEEGDDWDTPEDRYKFIFVGMVTVHVAEGKDTCFIAYPKYYWEFFNSKKQAFEKGFDENHEIISELLAVIRRCKIRVQEQEQKTTNTDGVDDFNLLGFTLDLMDDYYQHGLYSNDKDIVEVNGEGQILWDKTIADMPMYLSDGVPVYLTYYTENTTINDADIVRAIHASVLSTCSRLLRPILSILHLPEIVLTEHEVTDFGDESYLTYRLHQEYTTQFVTHKQTLINKLIYFIHKTNSMFEVSDISFVGTTNMPNVWENVCAIVKGNSRYETLKDLGLTHEGAKTISDVIPSPLWVHYESENEHKEKTLVPDIIAIDIKKQEMAIYDAKYYLIRFTEDKIEGNPGVGDVTKQYLYQKAYMNFARNNNLRITENTFLMPTAEDSEHEKVLGHVRFSLFADDGLEPITVMLLSAREMYKRFLLM